ncbi:L,D-transpeptidase [Undibacter mobilis]|uniref:L,D-transpeptidase n=1 Tax=Undibacter mobilis TaxID=2292256 RepID=A0A371BA14_9BRAD|nr:L,D-transpeptidase [Undibacter mobilis]RDV04420.1 L,D-transpeptidase [Undibacter mobilis]
MRCVGVAVAVAFLGLAPSVAQAEIVITISKAQQRVAVAVDGAERFRWPVSTGRRGFDTPVGKFRPVRLEKNWYSRKYDWAPMPNSIFFYRGYAMHGTTEERNLGRRASHGCVRLSREHAATLFAMVRERGRANARIVVVNGPLPKQDYPAETPMAAVEQPADAAAALARATDDDVIQVTVTPDALPLAKPAVLTMAPPRDDAPAAMPLARPVARQARPARAEKFTSVGSEAAVLRGREAWLRSLDRKYGIVR